MVGNIIFTSKDDNKIAIYNRGKTMRKIVINITDEEVERKITELCQMGYSLTDILTSYLLLIQTEQPKVA